MNKMLLIISTIVILTSCDSSSTKQAEGSDNLNLKVNQLTSENDSLKRIIEMLKFPASDRLKEIQGLMDQNNFDQAINQIEILENLYPLSEETKSATKLRETITIKKDQIKAEQERIKALGFKALKEEKNITVSYNKISVGDFSIAQTFTFDAYSDEWHLYTADRGNKYISARITITSTDKDPNLPVFYAYSISGEKLHLLGEFVLKFARWEDYATYLGNYNDNKNDFSKTASIPFKIGIELSDDQLSKPIVIVLQKMNTMSRSYERFNNPPVSYTSSGSYSKSEVTIDDVNRDYAVVKILNKNKI